MKPIMPGASTLREEWEEVRKSVAINDLNMMIREAIALIGQNHANKYWEPVTDIESILREHFSQTKGDSGIPNTHHRYNDPVSHIINNSQEKWESCPCDFRFDSSELFVWITWLQNSRNINF